MKALLEKAIRHKRETGSLGYDIPVKERDLIWLEFKELLGQAPQAGVNKLPAFQSGLKKWSRSVFPFLLR